MKEIVNVSIEGKVGGNSISQYSKKVILNDKKILENKDFQINSKYVIKWNFDLNNNTITIPENCILEFDGGSLNNGTIILNNDTQIIASGKVFGDNLKFKNASTIPMSVIWFGAQSTKYKPNDQITDDDPDLAIVVQRMINAGCYNIFIPANNYFWRSKVTCKGNVKIIGNFTRSYQFEAGFEPEQEKDYSFFAKNSIKTPIGLDVMFEFGDYNPHKNNNGEWVFDYTRAAVEMSGLNIRCAYGSTTAIMTGWIGWSSIHDNTILYCGYFFSDMGKPYLSPSWYSTNRQSLINYGVKYEGTPDGSWPEEYTQEMAEKRRYYGGITKVSRIYKNYVGGISKAAFQCCIGDAYIYDNYMSGSGRVQVSEDNFIKCKTFFVNQFYWPGVSSSYFMNNYIDYFYIVYNGVSGTQIYSSGNCYDITTAVFDSFRYIINAENPEEEKREAYDDTYGLYGDSFTNISSINDIFMRINNWDYINRPNTDAANIVWEFEPTGNDNLENDTSYNSYKYQSTRNHLLGADGYAFDKMPPSYIMNNGVSTGYYKREEIYSIMKVIPSKLNLVIGNLEFVDYILYTHLYFNIGVYNQKESGFYWNIIGGNEKYFKFPKIRNGIEGEGIEKEVIINIPALNGIIVNELPKINLYKGRTVIYNGIQVTYNGKSWGGKSVSSEVLVSNPDVNECINKITYSIQDSTLTATLNSDTTNEKLLNVFGEDLSKNNYSILWGIIQQGYINQEIYSLKQPTYSDNIQQIRYYPRRTLDDLEREIYENHGYWYRFGQSDKSYMENLIPNKSYMLYVQSLLGNDIQKETKQFNTIGSVRLLNINGVKNTRDIGGWNCSGGKVMYNMIIRGGSLDNITSEGKKTLINDLGVSYEIDLKYYPNYELKNDIQSIDDTISISGETIDNPVTSIIEKHSVVQEISNYDQYRLTHYNLDSNKTIVKSIFERISEIFTQIDSKLSNQSTTLKYTEAIYIHCEYGRDRTGTIIALLLGLLGVNESDVIKDYDISNYYTSGADQLSNFVTFIQNLKNKDTENHNFNQGVINYLNECEIQEGVLDNIKHMLIETVTE